MFSRNSTRKPLNLINSLIFTNTPCKPTCLYNAPSMHTVETIQFLPDISPVPNISTLAVLIRPGKSSQNARSGSPRMNFPEFPGSAFFLALLHSLMGNPEFPGIFRHFPGEGFCQKNPRAHKNKIGTPPPPQNPKYPPP